VFVMYTIHRVIITIYSMLFFTYIIGFNAVLFVVLLRDRSYFLVVDLMFGVLSDVSLFMVLGEIVS
jgi:hypothetical protein